MSFLVRILTFLFWVLILSWGGSLLRRAVAWMLRGQTAGSPRGAVVSGGTQSALPAHLLVRDPVCGVHVAEELAIALDERSGVVHFCSTACRDKYAAGTRKYAANE